jgi:hypothetical protein
MKTVKATATAATNNGEKLAQPISYEFTFEAYENIGEMRAANDMLSDDEVVDAKNRVRKNSARNRAQAAALEAAGIEKPTLENSPRLRLLTIHKSLVAGGKTDTEAREIASMITGVAWPE